jgi:hemoglobin
MKTLRHTLLTLAVVLPMGAWAQTPTLYDTLGGKPGVEKIVETFVANLLEDPRIKDQFAKTNIANLKMRLAEQFCQVSAGPCVYKGADMKTAHNNLDITKSNFNALVEDLQLAMDKQGVAFADQNRLLSLLAPMHRDIITVK